jgi:4,5-DOPA dioxygenase extradiol
MNHDALINFSAQRKSFGLSILTPEHYLPLLYALSLQTNKDKATIFNYQPVSGFGTMTSVKIENA